MHIINNINAKTFSHNGRNYVKNFIVIKQGATNIAIHNAYDTKFQLVGSTHFSQFQVNGVVYTSQADLMANLVNILFVKNLGNGAISNTSELINDGADGINPFVTVADLPSANKILNQTGYNLSGETLTINADWVWLIANQQYTNPAEVVINVPLASSGMTRIDLIVANNNNTFQRIAGTEAENNAIAPPVPNNTIQATLIVVTDGIIETEPTPVGDLYLEKADEGVGYFGSSSGIIENFILKKYTNYIILDSSSVTQINSASFLSPVFNYVGKRIRITNQQSTPIVFKHNFGIGVLQFDLVNDTDYILGSDETISFIVQDDYTLLHVAEININSLPIPTLQEVTDIGNSTTNGISANGGFATQNGLTDMELGTPYFGGSGRFSFNTSGDGVEFPSTNILSINANIEEWINLNTYDVNIGSYNSISLTPYNTNLYYGGVDNIAGLSLNENGIGLQTNNALGFLKTDILSDNRTYQFPDSDGTLALLSDIPSGNTSDLQTVTDAGATTSNVISATNGIQGYLGPHSQYAIGTTYDNDPTVKHFLFRTKGNGVDFPNDEIQSLSVNPSQGIVLNSYSVANTAALYVKNNATLQSIGYNNALSNLELRTSDGSCNTILTSRIGIGSSLRRIDYTIKPTGIELKSITGASLVTSTTNILSPTNSGTRDIYLPTNSGTLALTSDLSSASSEVWKKSGLSTNANLVNEKIYRQNNVNLIGQTISFATAPTQADADGEILGSQFGHIYGNGTVPFIQLLGNGNNGSAGPNQFISRMAGAPTTMQQMTFSAIKSTNYDAWGDAGRLLWRFQDGYLYPQAKFDIGTDYVRLHSYPSTRNDTGDTMNNVLFTTSNGSLRSKPVANAPFISKSTGTTYTTNAIKTVTQAEYDAIVTKDPNTLYFII